MTSKLTLWEEAAKRASGYAPPPKYSPAEAGFAGAFATFLVLIVFGAFTGLDDAFETEKLWTTTVGFALPFLYFWRQQKRNEKATFEEYRQLSTRQTASSAV